MVPNNYDDILPNCVSHARVMKEIENRLEEKTMKYFMMSQNKHTLEMISEVHIKSRSKYDSINDAQKYSYEIWGKNSERVWGLLGEYSTIEKAERVMAGLVQYINARDAGANMPSVFLFPTDEELD